MTHPAIKPAVFLLCLLPFAMLFLGALQGELGPDPAEHIMHVTGEWGGRILILTLLITPLRQRWGVLIRLRRMLGLFVFFYACLHLLTYGHFFLGWELGRLAEELIERPYITVGFSAWLLMLPLAVTSTNAWQRRLRKRWQQLHTLIYPAALLFAVHVAWLSRSDFGQALFFGLCVAGLLGWRVWRVRAAP